MRQTVDATGLATRAPSELPTWPTSEGDGSTAQCSMTQPGATTIAPCAQYTQTSRPLCLSKPTPSLGQDAAEVADENNRGDAQHDVEEVVAGHGGVCGGAGEALYSTNKAHTRQPTHATTHSPRRQSPGTPHAASISGGTIRVGASHTGTHNTGEVPSRGPHTAFLTCSLLRPPGLRVGAAGVSGAASACVGWWAHVARKTVGEGT